MGAAATVMVAALAGCGGGGGATPSGGVRLNPADFATSTPGASRAEPPPASPPTRSISADAARGGAGDVVVLTGPPSAPPVVPSIGEAGEEAVASREPASGRESRLLVDQLVGQINGRPVYADEFFDPMDERLRREAERLNPRDWLAFARREIEAALWDKLRDELLLAEFETGLSPQQRQGLFAFIEEVRRDLISGNVGSEALANQRLREAEGLGLEEKVKDVTQREFIAFQLKKSIGSRVSVASRDIQRYYEQHLDEFVPPPVARFVILRVPVSNETALADAESALAAGEPFEQIAARLSTWRPDQANTAEIEFTGEFSEASLFGPLPLNEAARKLAVGGVSPRVDFGSDAYWLHLAAIDRKPGKSIYEVQREIEQKIRAQRIREEETRYFEQLFRRGSFSDVKQMTRRLVEFAAERYLIRGRPAREE